METRLLDVWLRGLPRIEVLDRASVSVVREAARELGAQVGLVRETIEIIAIAASELAQNQLRHAIVGWIGMRAIERAGISGVELVAADRGPGIERPVEAVRGGASSSGLGAGLSAVFRLMDEVDLDLRLTEGSCVRARKFASAPPYRSEVAVMAAPCPGESINGDAALFTSEGDRLLLCVADGLGHGDPARQASSEAIDVAEMHARESIDSILIACDRALVDTRGAAMNAVSIDRDSGRLRHAGIGNVVTLRHRLHDSRRFASRPGFLGSRGPRAQIQIEDARWEAGDLLLMFTDGFRSATSLDQAPFVIRQHPIFAAAHLFDQFRRDTDDAAVLVASG